MKKGVDKTKKRWYNSQAVREGQMRHFKNLEKFFQKSLEKGIDKAEEMWYNSQAVAQEGAAKRMVIEN